MQDKSLVTIICLCYNQENYREFTICYQSGYKLIELIIVDDYSTDNSKSVIEEMAS
jgi:glycosyltransferase involved in cell wall biosynthesis